MFLTPSKSLLSTDHCAIFPNRSESVSFGAPPPDVTDEVELSSEHDGGGELRRRLVLPSAIGIDLRRLLRVDLLSPLLRFLLDPWETNKGNFSYTLQHHHEIHFQ